MIARRYCQRHFAGCVACALLMVLALVPRGQAADLLVWSAGAAKPAMQPLVASFAPPNAQAAVRVTVDYAPVGVLLARLAEGGRPDVMVLSADVQDKALQQAWAKPGSVRPLGTVGVGVAVRQGAALPDISTPEALRQTLLRAKSLTYMDPLKGTSGKHFANVLRQLGIADQVAAKTTLGDSGFVVEPVARGDIELGVQQITEILPVKGAQLLGPLPPPLQKITTYVVMLGAKGQQPELAQQLVEHITQAAAWPVWAEHGFGRP